VVSKPPTPDRPEDLDDPTGIRALLAALPDPGPMPAHLVDRINASITAEQEARAGSSVVSLDERRRPWRRIGLAAAAAAVAAVAVPALLTGTGPGGMLASLSGAHQGSAARSASSRALESSTQSPAPSTADGSAGHPATAGAGTPSAAGKDARMAAPGGGVTVYASNAAYTTAGFAEQLRGFVDHPGHPMQPLAAESPSIGPAGTPIGLQPCVQSLHLDSSARVMVDLATFDGAAAVVLVVRTDTGQTGWAMPRTCTTGHTNPFAGPVALP
jgi:hypothetical protein